jgi:membrane-bound lytic murein transglycosylase MltF
MSTLGAILLSLTFLVPGEAVEEIAYVESRHNPRAVSPAGAQGLMQVMPATARDPGFGVEPLENPWDAEENRRFGREYFSALLQEFGSVKLALMAYNWGPYNVERWIDHGRPEHWVPDETKRYVELLEEPVKKAIKEDWRDRLYSNLKSAYDKTTYARRDGTRCQTKTPFRSSISTRSNYRQAKIAALVLHELSQPGPIPSFPRHPYRKKQVRLKDTSEKTQSRAEEYRTSLMSRQI